MMKKVLGWILVAICYLVANFVLVYKHDLSLASLDWWIINIGLLGGSSLQYALNDMEKK